MRTGVRTVEGEKRGACPCVPRVQTGGIEPDGTDRQAHRVGRNEFEQARGHGGHHGAYCRGDQHIILGVERQPRQTVISDNLRALVARRWQFEPVSASPPPSEPCNRAAAHSERDLRSAACVRVVLRRPSICVRDEPARMAGDRHQRPGAVSNVDTAAATVGTGRSRSVAA